MSEVVTVRLAVQVEPSAWGENDPTDAVRTWVAELVREQQGVIAVTEISEQP